MVGLKVTFHLTGNHCTVCKSVSINYTQWNRNSRIRWIRRNRRAKFHVVIMAQSGNSFLGLYSWRQSNLAGSGGGAADGAVLCGQLFGRYTGTAGRSWRRQCLAGGGETKRLLDAYFLCCWWLHLVVIQYECQCYFCVPFLYSTCQVSTGEDKRQ